LKRESNLHFAILGDGRTDNEDVIGRHKKITELAGLHNPDLMFYIGDQLDTGEQIHWDRFWRQITTGSDPDNPGLYVGSYVPCYLLIGNHEIYINRSENLDDGYGDGNIFITMERFSAYVDNPSNGSANTQWEERYFSFTYGPATFIALDTNNSSGDYYDNHIYLPDGSTPDWEPESEQYLWMVEELKKAQNNSVFTFVLMHPSPYSRGTHGRPGQAQTGWNVRALDTIFRKYGVDAVFGSHDHLVERCLTGPSGFEVEMDENTEYNLNYFVLGNSGHSSRKAKEGWESWMDILGNDGPPYYSLYYYDWEKTDHASYLDVDIEKERNGEWKCTFKIIRDDENIFDEFCIERKDPLNLN